MDKLLVGLLIAVATIIKLIFTGLFLVIGFRIGGKIYETFEPKVMNKFNKVTVAPATEPVTQGA